MGISRWLVQKCGSYILIPGDATEGSSHFAEPTKMDNGIPVTNLKYW